MKWSEFRSLLVGISSETALGKIVSIRAENDPNMLKSFTPEQNRIRAEWRNKRAARKPQEQVDSFLDQMKKAFISLAGGEKEKQG